MTIHLTDNDGACGAAIHAQLAALAAVDINEGGFVGVDAHQCPGLANGLGRAAAADATTVVIDP